MNFFSDLFFDVVEPLGSCGVSDCETACFQGCYGTCTETCADECRSLTSSGLGGCDGNCQGSCYWTDSNSFACPYCNFDCGITCKSWLINK